MYKVNFNIEPELFVTGEDQEFQNAWEIHGNLASYLGSHQISAAALVNPNTLQVTFIIDGAMEAYVTAYLNRIGCKAVNMGTVKGYLKAHTV